MLKVQLDPCRSWQNHSGNVGADFRIESTESLSVLKPVHIQAVICPEHHMLMTHNAYVDQEYLAIRATATKFGLSINTVPGHRHRQKGPRSHDP